MKKNLVLISVGVTIIAHLQLLHDVNGRVKSSNEIKFGSKSGNFYLNVKANL
ncbi:hypothetical protein [Sphingobacterium anhuiense]|uniref:hypothetical protein n=1 Tax=Sphingobacterium anhuiense TaxID=493780 RepID=UPI003C306649